MSSWFTELAGKAENILNKIDQNAATVLQQQQQQPPQHHQQQQQQPQQSHNQFNYENNNNHSSLIINNRQLEESPKKSKLLTTPKKALLSNLKINNNNNNINGSSPKIIVQKTTTSNDLSNITINNNSLISNQEQTVNDQTIKNTNSSSIYDDDDDDVPIVDKSTSSIIIIDQDEVDNQQSTIKNHSNQSSSLIINNSTIISLLQNDNVEEQFNSKESLQSEHSTEILQNTYNGDDVENNYNDTDNDNVNDGKSKYESNYSLDGETYKQIERYKLLENENINYIKSISALESTVSRMHNIENELNEKLTTANSELERVKMELQQYRSRAQITLQQKENLIEQLKCSNNTSQKNQKNTDYYNNRNDDSASHQFNDNTNNNDKYQSSELNQLKIDNQNLLHEMERITKEFSSLKNILQQLENEKWQYQCDAEQKYQSIMDKLKNEQYKGMQLENNIKGQLQELLMVREEMERQRLHFTKQIHERDIELNGFRTQIGNNIIDTPTTTTTTLLTNTSNNNIDDRINSLTKSLVDKQNSLELVMAERNAVRLQVEQLENQHNRMLRQLREQQQQLNDSNNHHHHHQRQQILNGNDTDDVKAAIPNFLQENPFDTRVTRRVKRAYSSLDSVGVRVGVFLRRYPLIRILTIFYVFILHLWVMFILFSSTPPSSS